MILMCLSTILAALVPSAPAANVTLSLNIDGKQLQLTDVRLQSATTTSGRPTFVVMARVGEEPVFVRATLPQAQPGSYRLRGMRIREDPGPYALLNIDCRKDKGLPVLRHVGGTLVVTRIVIRDDELIGQFEASFDGEMSETSGAKHPVILSLKWGD